MHSPRASGRGARRLALVATLLATSATPVTLEAQVRDPIRVTLSLDRTRCAPGDTLRATLVATNTGTDTVGVMWTSGQLYDFHVLTTGGRHVWNWASDLMFDQAIHPRDLAPGQQLTYSERVPLPRESGTWVITGVLTTQPAHSASARVTCGVPGSGGRT